MAKKNLVVGLDLGEEHCTLVALDPKKNQIEHVATWNDAHGRKRPSELGEGLHAWLSERKLDKGVKSVAISLSGVGAMLRLVESDAGIPLEDAARFEARTWFGVSDNDLWINSMPHGLGAHNEPAQLVAAVRRTASSRVSSVCDAANLPLQEANLDIVAAANAFETNYPSWSDRLVAVVLANNSNLQIYWTQERKFLGHSVIVAQGTNPSDELALAGAKALQEGTGLVRGQADSLGGVFLCGQRAAETGFAARLGTGIRVDVRLLDSFASLPFPSAESMAEQISELSPRCATALGLALALSQGDRS
jgi:Tfp pilus assembly PilM family ATPase